MRRACLVSLGACGGIGLCLLAWSGCREEEPAPAPAETELELTPPAVETTRISHPSAQDGVDDADDPDAPNCLPKTGDAGVWTKIEPVEVFPPQRLDAAVPPPDDARLRHFHILSVARCVYGMRHSSGARRMAHVLLIQTGSAADAFGLLTCASDSDERLNVGGQTQIERRDGFGLHCWQGRAYVKVLTAESDSETTDQIVRLLLNISGRIPREDRPALLDAMPTDSASLEARWLVRNLESLPPGALGITPSPDPRAVSGLLKLDRSSLMCIGRYHVPEGRQPNVVWLVSYAGARAAYDAHAKYERHLARESDAASRSTNILPPHGAFLLGTWTAEEESIQYMLPRINKLLPS